MSRCFLTFLLIFILTGCGRSADNAAENQQMSLAATNDEVQKLADGFRFTEGPASNKRGDVYFSDIPNNRIHIWSLENNLTTFLENSGGANGLYFTVEMDLIACQGRGRQLVAITSQGEIRVLADSYQGNRFNSPNDLWIHPAGGVYFTDPRYGNRDNMEMGEHVYYLSPDRERLVRVIDDMERPNGVIGTPDGQLLYVADHGGGATHRYSINPDGTLSDKTLYVSQGSDGMTVDHRGNIYLTGEGVDIFNPEGDQVGSIQVPERPTNLCFGGPGHDELYITARTGFYMIPMDVHGVRWE